MSTATATSGAAPRTTIRSLRSDRAFFSTMAIITACTIIAGFSRTYYLKALTGAPSLPLFVHVHAAIFTSWLVLLVVQTTLVARGRSDIHRRLGVAGAVLAALMISVGTVTAVTGARLGYRGIPGQEFPDAEGFMLVPLRDILVFATLIGAGLLARHNAPAHKRLMLTAAIGGLLPPAAARLPLVSSIPPLTGAVLLLLLLAGPLYDFVYHRRVHPVYVWGGLLSILTLPPVLAPIALGRAWHSIAHWLIS